MLGAAEVEQLVHLVFDAPELVQPFVADGVGLERERQVVADGEAVGGLTAYDAGQGSIRCAIETREERALVVPVDRLQLLHQADDGAMHVTRGRAE